MWEDPRKLNACREERGGRGFGCHSTHESRQSIRNAGSISTRFVMCGKWFRSPPRGGCHLTCGDCPGEGAVAVAGGVSWCAQLVTGPMVTHGHVRH